MDTEVNHGAFTYFYNFFFYLFGSFFNHFLNACRVNTPVGYELVQRKTCDFATYRVEAREDNRFGGIVYNDFDPSSCFEGTDIAPFTTNDTTFHLIRLEIKYRYAIVYGFLSTYTLNGVDDDFARFLVSSKFGFFNGILDISHRVGLGFTAQ